MADAQYFPLIEVSGSPRERGLAYGRAAAERVKKSIVLYRGELARRKVDVATQDRLAQRFLPIIGDFDPAYVEEMRAIAEGAGVPVEGVVTVNCRTEMMFGFREVAEAHAQMKDGCTGVVAMPSVTVHGRLIHAHNWDWRQEAADNSIVLRVRSENGPDMLTLVEAGGLARHGFNAAGVALTANFLACDRDFKAPGQVPLGILRRKILEQTNLANAVKAVATTTRFCSNNIMLSDAAGEAIDLECVPDETFWIQPDGGLLPHSNHFLSPVARAKVVDTQFPRAPDTLYRASRVYDYLAARRGKIDYKDCVEALSDRYGFPDSVLRSPKPAVFDAISATVCMTIIDAKLGRMWLARKPYERIDFAEYAIAADTAGHRVACASLQSARP
jgi:isopenicillin-N N-acyltransferase like protein